MIVKNDSVKDLLARAGALASAADSLATLFEKEGIRLKRGDQLARLRKLHAFIVSEIEQHEYEERQVVRRHSEREYDRRRAKTVIGAIGDISNADWLKKLSQNMAKPIPGGAPVSGTVMIRIGPGGVPDDVHVVSISSLARESKRSESDVIVALQKAKNQLQTENEFTGLMSWLAQEILEGRQSLPFKPKLAILIPAPPRFRPREHT
jgi:hypothetical protein